MDALIEAAKLAVIVLRDQVQYDEGGESTEGNVLKALEEALANMGVSV